MKNKIISFLILIFIPLLAIGILKTNGQTNKSFIKKQYIIKRFHYNHEEEMNIYINNKAQEGYKFTSLNGAGNNSLWYLVMEK